MRFPAAFACNNQRAKIEVLKDIADEELVHAGEFLKLLHHLAPKEAKLYEKGAKEVDGILDKVQKK